MGCDIHLNYEVKTSTGWKLYDWKAKYQTGQYSDGPPMTDWSKAFEDPLYVGRNYNLFALLANVRNDYIYIQPMSSPRGLPYDVTDEVKTLSDDFGVDGHSHSWMTLSEVAGYDYKKEIIANATIYTLREVIGESWFATLEHLKAEFGLGNVRLVFWFDN